MDNEQTRRSRQKSWMDLVMQSDELKDDPLLKLAGLSMARLQKENADAWDKWSKSDTFGYDPIMHNGMMFILLAETSSDPHFIKDASFKYVYVNRAMERTLNRPKKDIIGLTDAELFSHGDALPMRVGSCQAFHGTMVHQENVRTINGLDRTFLDTLVPLKDAAGKIVRVFGISVDITDRQELVPRLELGDRESRSPVMQYAYTLALNVAKVDSTVLLTGESGCGKDHMARFIREHSTRAGGAYKRINCGALPEKLIESELFGHEKGAFSGADRLKKGYVELAHGGTLFLNEIGELPLPSQTKLLTFLDDKYITRVGAEKEIKVDVRIMAATNKNLREEVEKGTFRSDLFYRLNVFPIHIPPVRERKEDLPVLAQSLLDKIVKELKLKSPVKITPSLVATLTGYHWPGNVRELGNVLEKAVILATAAGIPLNPSHLDLPTPNGTAVHSRDNKEFVHPAAAVVDKAGDKGPHKRPKKPSDQELRHMYKDYIEGQGRTREDLAQELGVDRTTLSKWFKAAGLVAGDQGRPRKKVDAKADGSTKPNTDDAMKKPGPN